MMPAGSDRSPARGRARRRRPIVAYLLTCLAAMAAVPAPAQAVGDSLASGPARPFVPGGFDDKPHLTGLFGRIAVGGYLEVGAAWTREDGVTDDLGVELTRFNLITSTSIHDRVGIFSEIEFEEGGEEITVELAQVDVHFARAFNPRAGLLLLPLGRFNLAHDAPRNELASRPAEAEALLGVALAQPGLGAWGRFDRPGGQRWTYELYAVTGYRDGIISDSPDGTRLPAGRRNPEDENASPAFVGRLEWSPGAQTAFGLSGYRGAYNVFRSDGLVVDQRRDLSVAVLDLGSSLGPVAWSAEGAVVDVEVPPALAGLFARRQAGAYVQAAWRFGRGWVARMPGSWFAVAARLDGVDFDRDLPGDSMRSLSLGLSFRPVPETAIKIGVERGEARDRFNNPAAFARIRLGLASYF